MPYFRLKKNNETWDCFDHPDDVAKYVSRILQEEPNAKLKISSITKNKFLKWLEQ